MKGVGEINLEDLGYSAFFAAARKELGLDGCAVARVIAEHRGAYRVKDTHKEYLAAITGKQMHGARVREDYPAVGDWVAFAETGEGKAVIHRVLPRKTLLKRKYSGRFESQVIAANIDMAFVIESSGRDYNLNRMERYLTLAKDGGIKPVIVLNKIDLVSESESESKSAQLEKRFEGVCVIKTSAVLAKGLDDMAALIPRGETCCLLGSSGVGKSTLINQLLGRDVIRTDSISHHTGKGKHTTSAREMYFLESGGILIDSPGMREIGMVDSSAGIDDVFNDVTILAKECRFVDCTHIHEPGCAVREAVAQGELDEDRYANYLKLSREAEYYELTNLEKRRKDREFGRFVKKAKKDWKKQGR